MTEYKKDVLKRRFYASCKLIAVLFLTELHTIRLSRRDVFFFKLNTHVKNFDVQTTVYTLQCTNYDVFIVLPTLSAVFLSHAMFLR